MATEFICLLVMAHFLGSDDGLALYVSAFEFFLWRIYSQKGIL